jgi:hypothetical protein
MVMETHRRFGKSRVGELEEGRPDRAGGPGGYIHVSYDEMLVELRAYLLPDTLKQYTLPSYVALP